MSPTFKNIFKGPKTCESHGYTSLLNEPIYCRNRDTLMTMCACPGGSTEYGTPSDTLLCVHCFHSKIYLGSGMKLNNCPLSWFGTMICVTSHGNSPKTRILLRRRNEPIYCRNCDTVITTCALPRRINGIWYTERDTVLRTLLSFYDIFGKWEEIDKLPFVLIWDNPLWNQQRKLS